VASVRLVDLLDGEHVSQPQSATIFLLTPSFSVASENSLPGWVHRNSPSPLLHRMSIERRGVVTRPDESGPTCRATRFEGL
jgi:hypothetical protein